jgi:hypothetical protein
LGVAFFVSASQAQESPEGDPSREPICGPLPIISDMLMQAHGEAPVAHQVMEGGHIITAFVDSADGSWTIVAHDMAHGCVISGGYGDTLPATLAPFVDVPA